MFDDFLPDHPEYSDQLINLLSYLLYSTKQMLKKYRLLLLTMNERPRQRNWLKPSGI
jgi:hypothetical protein